MKFKGLTTILLALVATSYATNIHWVRVFGANNEKMLFANAKTLNGHCMGPSSLLQREDAFQCQAETGKVYPFCFGQVGKSQVICLDKPWTTTTTILKLSQPLNIIPRTTLDISKAWPWAIETMNQQHCIITPGNQGGDWPVHYQCEDGAYLTDPVQKCKGPWKLIRHQGVAIDVADVSAVWF